MRTLRDLSLLQLFIALAVIVVVAEFFANMAGDDSSVGAWLGLTAFGLAVGGALIFLLVPRVVDSTSPGLVMALLALVTVVVFWSALPFALGAAALSAAGPADDSAEGEAPAPATAGVILAVLASVAAFVLCIIG